MSSSLAKVYARQRIARLRKRGLRIKGGETHGPAVRADLCAVCWEHRYGRALDAPSEAAC